MDKKQPKVEAEKRASSIKEYLLGLIALVLGGYNLAAMYGYVNLNVQIPQAIANVILVLAGILLIIAGFRRTRHEYFKTRFMGI